MKTFGRGGPIVQNQRGACIVPASQNQVLYCEPDLGVGASFGLGAATQTRAANTLAHTFIQRQERAANMPASWQPWHFGGTTPNSLVLARLLISLKLKTSSPQTLVLVCSHSSTACDDLRPPDSSVLFSPGLRLTSSLKYWQARVKFVTPQTWTGIFKLRLSKSQIPKKMSHKALTLRTLA